MKNRPAEHTTKEKNPVLTDDTLAVIDLLRIRILLMIYVKPGRNAAGIAELLRKPKKSVFNVIKSMTEEGLKVRQQCARGLVYREQSIEDRRKWKLFLTEKGTQLVEELNELLNSR